MNSTLPPTRDLPPGRQAQIRAELEDAVTRRRGPLRFAPLLAATAAVAAVVAGVVVLAPDPDRSTPADQPQPTPLTTPVPTHPDLTPEKVATIEEGCSKAAGLGDRATLYRFHLDDSGRWAVLYTDRLSVHCNIGRGGREYVAGSVDTFGTRWLTGHFTIDANFKASGGDTPPHRPAEAGAPGYRWVAGRVDSSVARVTYIAPDGKTVDAKIANGTYAARIVYPSTWHVIDTEDMSSQLRAFDAAGDLLGTFRELVDTCYYAPDTREVIHGDRDATADRCKPATPWR